MISGPRRLGLIAVAALLAAVSLGCEAFDYDCNDPEWIRTRDISVTETEARDGLIFEGTLVDADGEPIPNVRVDLYLVRQDGTSTGDYGRVAGTDSEGVYRTDLSVIMDGPREETVLNAGAYRLSFQPINKVRGVQYCNEVIERSLHIRRNEGPG